MMEWQIEEMRKTGFIEDELQTLEIEFVVRDLAALSEPDLWAKMREMMDNIEILTAAMRIAGIVPMDWTGPIGGHW